MSGRRHSAQRQQQLQWFRDDWRLTFSKPRGKWRATLQHVYTGETFVSADKDTEAEAYLDVKAKWDAVYGV